MSRKAKCVATLPAKSERYFENFAHLPLQRAVIDKLSTRLSNTEIIREIQIYLCRYCECTYAATCIFMSIVTKRVPAALLINEMMFEYVYVVLYVRALWAKVCTVVL